MAEDLFLYALTNRGFELLTLTAPPAPVTPVPSQTSTFLTDVCALSWSFTFLGLRHPVLGTLRDVALEVGARMDQAAGLLPTKEEVEHSTSSARSKETVQQPTIIGLFRGMCTVLKPPGWEVDSQGQSGLRTLSSFLRRELGCRYALEEPGFGWGFVHRLDVPSSGLLLVATNVQGYTCLEWQMCTYQVVRDYVVAGHSLLVPPRLHMKRRILDLTTAICSERGRPAETHLHALSYLSCAFSLDSPISLLAVRIRTGRRHQIRVHMRSVCPSVADHRYGLCTLILSHTRWPGRAPNDQDHHLSSCEAFCIAYASWRVCLRCVPRRRQEPARCNHGLRLLKAGSLLSTFEKSCQESFLNFESCLG